MTMMAIGQDCLNSRQARGAKQTAVLWRVSRLKSLAAVLAFLLLSAGLRGGGVDRQANDVECFCQLSGMASPLAHKPSTG